MGEPLVIASHLPGEGHFESERFEVRPVLCRDEWDYWRGLAAAWDLDRTLINVEHDNDASDEHLHALAACPHSLCAVPYHLHWISTGRLEGTVSCRDERGLAVEPGAEWAHWSALGLLKIGPGARTGPLRRERWRRLELAVAAAVSGPVHLHWMTLAHHHW